MDFQGPSRVGSVEYGPVDAHTTHTGNGLEKRGASSDDTRADALRMVHGNAVLSPCSDRIGAVGAIAVAFGRQ
jgi:hypothetical protein